MKKMSLFINICLFSCVIQNNGLSQSFVDTVYFSYEWKKGVDKSEAMYYGLYDILSDSTRIAHYYFITGNKQSVQHQKNIKKDGLCTWWYQNGVLEWEGTYSNDTLNGFQKINDNDEVDNPRSYYYREYKMGNLISEFQLIQGDTVYRYCQKEPIFDLASNSLQNQQFIEEYIDNNIKYPLITKIKKEKGDITVFFIIQLDGSVKIDGEPLNINVSKRLEKAAIKLAKKQPKWQPAEINGKKVLFSYAIRIKYNME